MRISDWSSDVCSSDLGAEDDLGPPVTGHVAQGRGVEDAVAVAVRRATGPLVELVAGLEGAAAGAVPVEHDTPTEHGRGAGWERGCQGAWCLVVADSLTNNNKQTINL